jgi:hypothetical protein
VSPILGGGALVQRKLGTNNQFGLGNKETKSCVTHSTSHCTSAPSPKNSVWPPGNRRDTITRVSPKDPSWGKTWAQCNLPFIFAFSNEETLVPAILWRT